MTIEYDPTSGTLRGTVEEIRSARTALRDEDAPPPAGLPVDDPILEAVRTALRTPMLALEVTNSGPGGSHRHLIDAGVNAVTVRWSTAGSDLAELAPSPFQVLPGAITRLVGFRPGRPPADGAPAVAVEAPQIQALASDDATERTGAWEQIRAQLGELVDPAEADASWQLVRSHCSWTATDGRATEDLAVYLRAGEAYFVLVQDGESLELVPAPSITAWEAMMQVLPGASEIEDPRP
ncbi:hypothetical protein [Brachybacterium sp. YJGR34]|uniref:hypothetical protein n=1 Tax=Brachybacterium sp. YJGR34 TaxID=2059911 RepID=UPI000E0C70C6|nr:hypothetical protein [Brachybacterium sp. YJGR34]